MFNPLLNNKITEFKKKQDFYCGDGGIVSVNMNK